jgi:hypothetical protein
MARRRVTLLCVLLALLMGVRIGPGVRVAWRTPAARAADGTPKNDDASAQDRAKEFLVQGVELLKRAQYQAALERFDAAYGLVASPNIHYDRALAYLGMGRQAAALEAFEAFLADASHPPSGKREQAQSHQTDLRTRVARLDASALPLGAEVGVDGSGRGRTPFARSIYLDPGPHEISIRLSATAGVIREPVNARPGQTVEVTLHPDPPAIAAVAPPAAAHQAPRLDPAGEPPPPAMSEPWLSSRGAGTGAIAAAAGGLVLLGAGVTFGILAQREGDSLTRDSRSATDAHPVLYDPHKQSSGKADQRLETVFVSAGAVALAGGIVLYALNRRRATESSAAGKSVRAGTGYVLTGAPLFGPGLAGANLRMRF